jgi:two-component system, OmpR family, sensor histidine kinase SenX3
VTWAVTVAVAVLAFGLGWVVAGRLARPGPGPGTPTEHRDAADVHPGDRWSVAGPVGGDPIPAAVAVDAEQLSGDLARALRSLPMGIVVADLAGEVVYRNAMAEGFAAARHGEALVESVIQDLLGQPDAGPAARSLELYGPPRRNLTVRLVPVRHDGVRTGSLVLTEDVTEQHRVDAVRRDFVANVSHELKTPVGAIGVLAEALRGEDDPAVIDRLAGRLQSEAIRLGNTIDDLLALSRIETELIEPVAVDLDAVVEAALDRTASAAELRDVRVCAIRPGTAVVVRGDRRQLVSAVGNLVENAIKYSDPASEVTVAVTQQDDWGQIRVIDRGVGIPEADLERIFERFYRVDPARSRNTGGSGLGLSIVRHVALNHGGEVRVESAEGKGSTFALLVPVGGPPPRPGAERSTQPGDERSTQPGDERSTQPGEE